MFLFLAAIACVGYFWDEIREWFGEFVETVREYLPGLAEFLEEGFVIFDRVVSAGRRFVKRAIVFFQTEQGEIKSKVTESIVDLDDLPSDIRANLLKKRQVKTAINVEV